MKLFSLRNYAGALCLLVVCTGLSAQTKQTRLDLFAGVDFNYRNIHYNNRLYDLLINLTPGVKWQMGNHWQVAVQGLIPIVNDYGARYKKIRLNMAVISKELYAGKQFLKVSGGLFGQERYGIDVKWMCPMNEWLAFEGQAGYTGFCTMARDWECSKMDRLTALLGTRFFIGRYNTEFRLRGGRFLFEDYGTVGECMRHFRHCSVGIFAQYGSKGDENAGFKIVMMIPPYARKNRKVNVRPASNFRLTYNIQADPYSLRMYNTDPEENEREGWFDREKLKWGSNSMQADFKEIGGGK